MNYEKVKKPKYWLGIVHSGEETITVKKIYPRGHRYATKTKYGYLIHCIDRGEDELIESALGRLIGQSM